MDEDILMMCRTVAVVAVWGSSSMFLTFGLPRIQVGQPQAAIPFYLIAITLVILGAIVATAVLWLTQRRPSASARPAPAATDPTPASLA